MSCEVCGEKTNSATGVCQRTRPCKAEAAKRFRANKGKGAAEERRCDVCREPISSWNWYGVCRRYTDCSTEYRRRLNSSRTTEPSDRTSKFRQETAVRLWDEQGGKCAWPPCKEALDRPGTSRTLAIEHNHRGGHIPFWKLDTTSIRGLVHSACNREIAVLEKLLGTRHATFSSEINEYLRSGA